MQEQKRDSMHIWSINLLFLLVLLLFVTIGRSVQAKEIYSGLLITEFALIFMPALLYLIITRQDIKQTAKLNFISLKQAILVIGISITGYCVSVFLSLIVNTILSYFGDLIPSPLPTITNPREYIIGMLIIAGSAAVCEEFLFRGVILSGYQKLGSRKAVLISGLMFGFMHINVQNLVGPVVLGIILGYIVYKSNSIFTGILGHFTFNAIGVTLSYLASIMQDTKSNMINETSVLDSVPPQLVIVVFIIWAIIAAGAAGLLAVFLRSFSKLSEHKDNLTSDNQFIQVKVKGGILAYLPLIVAFGIIIMEMIYQILIIIGVVQL